MIFILPKDLRLESAPKPDDQRFLISIEPVKTWAALKYTGVSNEQNVKEKADELNAWLNVLSQYRRIIQARSARYDCPMVKPFLRRNEVQIQDEIVQ